MYIKVKDFLFDFLFFIFIFCNMSFCMGPGDSTSDDFVPLVSSMFSDVQDSTSFQLLAKCPHCSENRYDFCSVDYKNACFQMRITKNIVEKLGLLGSSVNIKRRDIDQISKILLGAFDLRLLKGIYNKIWCSVSSDTEPSDIKEVELSYDEKVQYVECDAINISCIDAIDYILNYYMLSGSLSLGFCLGYFAYCNRKDLVNVVAKKYIYFIKKRGIKGCFSPDDMRKIGYALVQSVAWKNVEVISNLIYLCDLVDPMGESMEQFKSIAYVSARRYFFNEATSLLGANLKRCYPLLALRPMTRIQMRPQFSYTYEEIFPRGPMLNFKVNFGVHATSGEKRNISQLQGEVAVQENKRRKLY